jgi:hypothetical protein
LFKIQQEVSFPSLLSHQINSDKKPVISYVPAKEFIVVGYEGDVPFRNTNYTFGI